MRICLRIVRRLLGGRRPVAPGKAPPAIPPGGPGLNTFEPWRPGR